MAKKRDNLSKFIYWLGLIIGILAILFILYLIYLNSKVI